MRFTIILSLFSFFSPPVFAETCNGLASLCERRYDQVVFPTTHNSTALEVGHGPHPVLLIPNQNRTIQQQLNDGIRGFMIDLWYWKNQVYTCHRFCELGGQPLLGVMKTFKHFLEDNPHEVVSIIFENYVSGIDVEKIFLEADLLSSVHTQVAGQPWPTLGNMIRAKKRLVIFKEFESDGPAWNMLVWKYAVETPYSYTSEKEFSCEFQRGSPENSLYIVNQFITVAFFRHLANIPANRLGTLLDRAHRCFEEKKKIPNFLTVDFYTPELMKAALKLNEEFIP